MIVLGENRASTENYMKSTGKYRKVWESIGTVPEDTRKVSANNR